jgi:hypothetical protein
MPKNGAKVHTDHAHLPRMQRENTVEYTVLCTRDGTRINPDEDF